jgi:hypothetical protein
MASFRHALDGAPTRSFVALDARSDGAGYAVIEGAAAIPGLPVCRVRLRADADWLFLYGPDVDVLRRYVVDALREDVRRELARN